MEMIIMCQHYKEVEKNKFYKLWEKLMTEQFSVKIDGWQSKALIKFKLELIKKMIIDCKKILNLLLFIVI